MYFEKLSSHANFFTAVCMSLYTYVLICLRIILCDCMNISLFIHIFRIVHQYVYKFNMYICIYMNTYIDIHFCNGHVTIVSQHVANTVYSQIHTFTYYVSSLSRDQMLCHVHALCWLHCNTAMQSSVASSTFVVAFVASLFIKHISS